MALPGGLAVGPVSTRSVPGREGQGAPRGAGLAARPRWQKPVSPGLMAGHQTALSSGPAPHTPGAQQLPPGHPGLDTALWARPASCCPPGQGAQGGLEGLAGLVPCWASTPIPERPGGEVPAAPAARVPGSRTDARCWVP